MSGCAWAETASWYSTNESKGVMANGELLDNTAYTCATWDYPFGTMLRVFNLRNGKRVQVVVVDRGPGRPKCSCIRKENSRTIDLSKRAFSKIADLKQGVIPIKIKVIK